MLSTHTEPRRADSQGERNLSPFSPPLWFNHPHTNTHMQRIVLHVNECVCVHSVFLQFFWVISPYLIPSSPSLYFHLDFPLKKKKKSKAAAEFSPSHSLSRRVFQTKRCAASILSTFWNMVETGSRWLYFLLFCSFIAMRCRRKRRKNNKRKRWNNSGYSVSSSCGEKKHTDIHLCTHSYALSHYFMTHLLCMALLPHLPSLSALDESGMALREDACWHPEEDWSGSQRFSHTICALAVSLASRDRTFHDQCSVWPFASWWLLNFWLLHVLLFSRHFAWVEQHTGGLLASSQSMLDICLTSNHNSNLLQLIKVIAEIWNWVNQLF